MENIKCLFCDKHYNFRDLYEKHRVACEYFFQNRRQRHRQIESIEKLPSQQELFSLVQSLALQCKTLTDKVSSLESSKSYRIRKNVINILQNEPRPTESFDTWIKSFRITDTHLNEIFEYNLTNGIKKCITDRINDEGLKKIPIRGFNEKVNVLYIFDGNTDSGWSICSKESFCDMINEVNDAIVRSFCKWHAEESEMDYEKQILCSIKVTGSNINKERQLIDIKGHVYTIIKKELV
jgi:hypothetical protein